MGIVLHLDDGSAKEFDSSILEHKFFPMDEHLHVFTKSDGTAAHRPVVALVFAVPLPDGSMAAACLTVTGREFMHAATAIHANHPGCGDRDLPAWLNPEDIPQVVNASYRGVGYNAMPLEKIFLLNVEGANTVSWAGSEAEAHSIAKQIIDGMLGK